MDATTQKTWWPEGPVGSGGGCSGGEVDTRSENVPAKAGASVSTAAPSAVAGVPPVEAAVATSEVAGVAPALEALASVATAASTEAAEATRQCAYAATGHCKGIGMLVKCQGSSGRPCPSGALMHHLSQVEFMDGPTVPRRILRPNTKNTSSALGHGMRRKCGRKPTQNDLLA